MGDRRGATLKHGLLWRVGSAWCSSRRATAYVILGRAHTRGQFTVSTRWMTNVARSLRDFFFSSCSLSEGFLNVTQCAVKKILDSKHAAVNIL